MKCDRCGSGRIVVDFEDRSFFICENCEKRFPRTRKPGQPWVKTTSRGGKTMTKKKKLKEKQEKECLQ